MLVIGPNYLGESLYKAVKARAGQMVEVTRDGTAPQIPQVPAGDSAHNVHGDGQALCTATFIYMNPTKEASLLLRYIDDYSTRSWKLKDSCMFNAGFSNLHFGWPSAGETQQWEFEDFLSFDSNNYTVSRAVDGGTAIAGAAQNIATPLVRRVSGCQFDKDLLPKIAEIPNLGSSKVFALNATAFAPQVAKLMLEKDSRADAFLVWSHRRIDGEDQIKCTLKSNTPNFDCAAVAQLYGGNGWPSTAGFVYKGASISGVLKNAKIPMEKVEFDATANNPYTNPAVQQEVLISAGRSYLGALEKFPKDQGVIVNCSTDLKEVSSLLQESTPDAKFVLAWFCNMRTKEITGHLSPIGDFDVKPITEAYNGDMHTADHGILTIEGDSIAPFLA